jgi:Flp pilus assembly protein TadD
MTAFVSRLAATALIAAGGLCGPADAATYAGSETCASCHAAEHEAWKKSHHYQAMLPANEETVLGDFSGTTHQYGGVTSRFFRRDGRFYVETDNAQGEMEEFVIAYTFGFRPLQQYLIAFPDGRYQALNVVWDARPSEQGGQRWIHLYPDPDNPVTHQDMVHWTGTFQNWNSRCASCHSTGLEKNYDSRTDRYETAWKEVNVACEACHGPASAHLEWARGDRQGADTGFTASLADRGVFGPREADPGPTMARLDGQRPLRQVESCAACHARRSEIADHSPIAEFGEQYRLALIEPGLYFPDGQVNQEVYVYGSFLQSRMHEAGVVCTNCHEAHSNEVYFDDNRLCAQCHSAETFDRPEHHRHSPGQPGAACVDCHMPSTTYMVVDDRRDHSFRVPEPRLTVDLGVPNACNKCHVDRSAEWASAALETWGMNRTVRAGHAAVLAAAWSGQQSALPDLLALANDEGKPPILRASAVLASGDFPTRDTLEAVQRLLASDNALLREAAVRSLDWLPAAERYALLRDRVSDPSKAVRMAVARQLDELPTAQLPPVAAQPLEALQAEYLEVLMHNADMPEEQMNLGMHFVARGDPVAAERAYRTALKLSPRFVPALLNLADLYRANGLDQKAKPLLREAIDMAPGQAPAHHAMGLLLVRGGELAEAVTSLQTAAQIEPLNARYSYVYAVALWETGQRQQAVAELEAALTRLPGNPELISALAAYYRQLGETEKLQKLVPNPGS